MNYYKYAQSLKSNLDFQSVYGNGKSFVNKYLVMYILKNNKDINRIGISVSKKVGNSVIRHSLTRLIRESYRLNEIKIKKGYDIVIVARVSAKGKNYREIESALLHLAGLHHILEDYEKNIDCTH